MRSALVVVALTVACASLPAATQQPTKRLALIVGIDQYESQTINDLQGCANDARDMKNLLRNRFEFTEDGVHTLVNEKATRDGILSEFRTHLIAKAEPGTAVVFHYSGHGSRVHDVSADQEEIDGWDETIVPHDSRTGSIFDITDDELNALLRELLQKTTNVTVILDSCHSGSGFRATSVRRAPDDERTPPSSPGRARGGREGTSDLRELALDYILISGARANELANEFFTADEQQRGAMTYFLTRTLREATGALTYRDVRDAVSREVTNAFPSQHPLFEGLRIDHTIFGVDTVAAEAYVSASPREEEGTAAVEGGATYGWRTGAVLEVYPPRTKTFTGPPAAMIELTRVNAFDSEGRITSGTVEPDSRIALRSIVFPDQVLRVHYENAAQEPLLAAVKAKLADVDSIAAVDNPQQASLILKAAGNGYAFHSPDLRQLSPAIAADAANAEKRLASQADQWARWHRILAVGNPAATPAISVDIRKQGAPRASSEFVEGDRIVVTVENISNRDLYITIVDLSDDGSSDPWYPEAGVVESLEPGKKLEWPVDVWVAEGRRSVVDTIKVFATTAPLNPAVFEQASVRALEAPRWSANPLAEFLERSIRGARGGTPARLDGWSTVSSEIVIRKDGPRLGGFIAHYDGRGGAALTTARSSLPVCDGTVADCYDVRAFGAEGTSAEIQPAVAGRTTLGTRGTPSGLGAAWEEAYRLRDKTGATRVEPILELEVESLAPEIDAITRSGGERPDRPGARNDNLWSLRHANVFAAWALLQAKGRADGKEGGGVVVAHPDTGYRKHAEIWNADANLSPITTAAGYDYVEAKNDPFDPLDRGGVLPNPGHGTKSSSAIISPKGKQWTGGGPNSFVDGVAPGARLLPLRVNRSVVHFNPTRLAQAIYDAASDDRTRVKKKADVVSISMGGVPSWGLHKAVRYAEQRGVIVVAAAGNEVGFVVWPARYPEVVGIAASNVDCGIWAGSSRGSAVAMTAPGESVWHAAIDENAREAVTMGQGTTYATATTAGIAALWLDYHRDDPGFSRLRDAGKLTSAFRDALRATAWKPADPPARRPQGVTCTDRTPWNGNTLGAGIVNAAAALRRPLPQPQTRSLSAEGDAEAAAESGAALSDLPLFRSLFVRGTDGAVVRERYRSIFGVPATRLQEMAIFEAEIVDQYALSEEVRAALENIIGPEPPTAAQYRAVRVELLRQDISPRLRSALEAASRS